MISWSTVAEKIVDAIDTFSITLTRIWQAFNFICNITQRISDSSHLRNTWSHAFEWNY